jgi:CMP-N,N'-diacetyllegionaminic acid synthase
MIDGLSVLAVITARGGSKGVPGKNVRPVYGRPLIAWTVRAATRAHTVDRVIVSTDDEGIAEASRAAGAEVPFARPAELATDTASSIDVILHALDAVPGFDLVVLLQPTSPLRNAADIDAAVERCVSADAPACVSVSLVEEHPQWMYRLGNDSRLAPVLPADSRASRRQDLPAVYSLNGAVYVARVDWLRRERSFLSPATVGYVMPRERALDIDTESDFQTLETFAGAFDHA